MAESQRIVRQSVSLPPAVARRVRALAKSRRTSANRVIVDLIESGLRAKEQEKIAFFELADRLTHSSDHADRKHIKEALAQMTFDEFGSSLKEILARMPDVGDDRDFERIQGGGRAVAS